jgi:hypothetical protein
MEPSQWLMEHAVENLFGESAGCVRQSPSARKHGFGEEQWAADHVSETETAGAVFHLRLPEIH